MARLSDQPARVAEFRASRERSGLGAVLGEAVQVSLGQTLFAVGMRDAARQLLAMGRGLGDGACFAEITDNATHLDHQGQGQDPTVVDVICHWMERHLHKGRFVPLIADPRAERLYQRFGFATRRGMARVMR